MMRRHILAREVRSMEFPIFKKKASFPEMRGFEEILDLSGINNEPIGISIAVNDRHICWHTFGVHADKVGL